MNKRIVGRRAFLRMCSLCALAPGALLAEETAYRRARPDYSPLFPRDHGSHPDYQTEWWYYTGQLYEEGRRPFADRPSFGFQLTFFRRGERPGDSSPWAQSYLAHAAISDLAAGELLADKRAARGGLSVAGASSTDLRTWNHEWSARSIAGRHVLELSVGEGGRKVELALIADAPRTVLHGENGFSRKAACDGCASIYYSLPRLSLEGEILRSGGDRARLTGLGWMDHEFMTNALTPEQEGWDWFSVMLADGRSLMLFELRKTGGGVDFSSGTLIETDSARPLFGGDFSIEVLSRWKSPRGKALYPSRWRVRVPSGGIDVLLEPRFADQEVYLDDPSSPVYWEGAVASPDESAIGYVEMTGYQKPLEVDL